MAKKAVKTTDDAGMALQNSDEGLIVDLSGVDENGDFPVMPRGVYPTTVESCTYEISQSGGNPMWSLILEVNEGEYQGQKLFTHIVFSEKALPRAKKAIMILKSELLDGPFNPEEQAEELVGIDCAARVDIKKYEGKDRNNVKAILPASAAGGSSESFM